MVYFELPANGYPSETKLTIPSHNELNNYKNDEIRVIIIDFFTKTLHICKKYVYL